jgi:hypothetical protein
MIKLFRNLSLKRREKLLRKSPIGCRAKQLKLNLLRVTPSQYALVQKQSTA